jgi:hypothetical protein
MYRAGKGCVSGKYELVPVEFGLMADERLHVPRPVGLVADHMNEIMEAYEQHRASMEPVESLAAAVNRVFTPAECADIISFLNGEQDQVFGAGSGENLLSMLLNPCEQFHQMINP